MIPVPDHEDDVRPDPLNDMLPADAVMAQDGVIEILDAGAGIWSHRMHRFLDPLPGKFSGYDRGIKANDTEFGTEYVPIRLLASVGRCAVWRGFRGSVSPESRDLPKYSFLGRGKLVHRRPS